MTPLERQLSSEEIVEQIMDAQADLQTGLGMFRVACMDRAMTQTESYAEDRLAKSLARTHKLLDALGHPMYQPATHSEV